MATLETAAGPLTIEADLPARAGRTGLVLAHGAGGDLHTRGLAALAHAVCELGFPVVRFNFPYRDRGARTPPAAEKSVPAYTAAFTAIRERFGGSLRWAAGGRSYGGRVASLAVAEGLPAAGLLLYSYPLHAPGRPDAPRAAHFAAVRVPCLFLQGTEDPFGGPDELAPHLARLGGPYRVERIEGGDHGLGVAGKKSPDRKRRTEEQVVAALAPAVARFLGELP
jgi:predicted alpha/beta-hydrolase family hydrolase